MSSINNQLAAQEWVIRCCVITTDQRFLINFSADLNYDIQILDLKNGYLELSNIKSPAQLRSCCKQ